MHGIVVGASGLGDGLDELGVEVDAYADERGVDIVAGIILKQAEQAVGSNFSGVGHGIGQKDDAVFIFVRVIIAVFFHKICGKFHAVGEVGAAISPYFRYVVLDVIHVCMSYLGHSLKQVRPLIEQHYAEAVVIIQLVQNIDDGILGDLDFLRVPFPPIEFHLIAEPVIVILIER